MPELHRDRQVAQSSPRPSQHRGAVLRGPNPGRILQKYRAELSGFVQRTDGVGE
jgi:hypothetical protein